VEQDAAYNFVVELTKSVSKRTMSAKLRMLLTRSSYSKTENDILLTQLVTNHVQSQDRRVQHTDSSKHIRSCGDCLQQQLYDLVLDIVKRASTGNTQIYLVMPDN